MRIMPIHIPCTASVMEILEFHSGNTSVGIRNGSNQIDMCLWLYTKHASQRPMLAAMETFQIEYTVGMLDAAADVYFRLNILLECWMPHMPIHPIIIVGSDAVRNRPPSECILPDAARRAVLSFMHNLHNGYFQGNLISVSTSADGFYTNLYRNQTFCTMYCEMIRQNWRGV
jgi:hypothetical protein